MKNMNRALKFLLISFIILSIGLFVPNKTHASTQDFYFEDFTADYYLSAAEDDTPKLHVKETLTAIFPQSNQNHGITRTIPFLNQADGNRTVESMTALNFTAMRNGKPENIAKTSQNSSAYTFYLGESDEFVHGQQVYTLEYDFTNVIAEFDENQNNVSGKSDIIKAFQELYWDTNGTDWQQEFKKLTANFHIDPSLIQNLKPEAWCYVGKYGDKGQERCTISKTDDGFIFSTENLTAKENLTFVVQFEPNTFQVILDFPHIETVKSYFLVWAFSIEAIICLIILFLNLRKWYKTAKPAYDLYKNTFTPPQYLPPEDKHIRVAEAEQLYLKNTEKSYVATLLELVVSKKASIIKTTDEKNPKKHTWAIRLSVSPDELSPSQSYMLKILGNEMFLKKDSDILIKKHTPTRQLLNYAESYNSEAVKVLEQHEYFVDSISSGTTRKSAKVYPILIFFYSFFALLFFSLLPDAHETIIDGISGFVYIELVGKEFLPYCIFVLFIATCIFVKMIKTKTKEYSPYTNRGIKMVRYLEGLEQYIKMAEQDRLKFLQSVEGADITNEGIVKLYEKLLPWASLFGVEDSWLNELGKYYEIGNIPSDLSAEYLNNISSGIIANNITQIIRSSTNYHTPSSYGSSWSSSSWSSSDHSGGGSSSSSGGGGGGGSGGGGGGGGGGGW